MTAVRRTVATWAAAVIIGAAAYATGGAVGDIARHTVDRTPAGPVFTIGCDPVDGVADVAPWIAAGWTSDPTDGREAIYAPGCRR